MSQPAVAALTSLPFELVFSDGEPLESYWHVLQMNLAIDVIFQAMIERGRSDFFVGGDLFVYYSFDQARDIVAGRPYFRGPDVFYVGGVERRERKGWVAWEEGGRLPDVIVELLSPSTAKIDRTVKKDLYARTFRTPEYFLYEPETEKLEGFRLNGSTYQPLAPNAQGRLWSEQLGLEFGHWHGVIKDHEATWLRLFHPDGRLAPTPAEAERQRAEAEHQRAEAERQRADAAEAELERLRARLGGGTT
jgi:Uma2 family endonuclease